MTRHEPLTGDDEIPPHVRDLISELVAREPRVPPPPSLFTHRPRAPFPKRFVVYGVAAAVVVLVTIGAIGLDRRDNAPVEADRGSGEDEAADPSSSTSPDPTPSGDVDAESDPIKAQLEADAEIAASFGLTLGPQVAADDGSIVIEDQPDLSPVYDGEELVGYARRADLDPMNAEVSLAVYGPDGETRRGVFDPESGFIPIEDGTPTPSIGE